VIGAAATSCSQNDRAAAAGLPGRSVLVAGSTSVICSMLNAFSCNLNRALEIGAASAERRGFNYPNTPRP
jgi:hypothetical protein